MSWFRHLKRILDLLRTSAEGPLCIACGCTVQYSSTELMAFSCHRDEDGPGNCAHGAPAGRPQRMPCAHGCRRMPAAAAGAAALARPRARRAASASGDVLTFYAMIAFRTAARGQRVPCAPSLRPRRRALASS